MIQRPDIPLELLDTNHFQEDISILIGENGSGKSTLLNELSKYFLRQGEDVVALANSIHDKFDAGHKNFYTLRGRSGRKQARSTIKKALENIAESDLQRLKNALRALEYVKFEGRIGFKIDNLSPNYNLIIASAELSISEKDELTFLLKRAQIDSSVEDIIWLQLDSYNFNELGKSSLTQLFKWESKLKHLKIITRIEVFLKKNSTTISMLEASSGELSLITSIVYLSTVITEKTVVLIDEPENSLHPKWQKEYAKVLFDIFYLFQPKIIIATHSPLIVNGAELFIANSKIYKAEKFSFEIQKKEPLNVEELLFRFFDINTPQNRFLSDRIVRLLNLLANKKIDLDNFENEINKIEVNSYDPKQIEVLKTILSIGAEISLANSSQN